jgi:CheY-like chemotaxis protein
VYVLIVDDEPLVREALVRLLSSMGHKTCWSANGKAALQQMVIEQPDLVLLDMLLGEGQMTGWDVLREKMLDPRIRGIHVIIVSGLNADDVHVGDRVAPSAIAGVTLIMGKPLNGKVLEKAIEMLPRIARTSTPPPSGEEGC